MKSQKEQRPTEESVTLKSGRTVIVREMDWKGYKRIKAQIVRLTAEKLTPASIIDMAAVMKSSDPMVTGIQALQSIAGTAIEAIDELTPVLIAGCIKDTVEVDSLPPIDVLRLREACTKVNDLESILGMEGNALAAVVQRIMAMTAADGGSPSNQPSPPDTAGVSLT